MTDLHGIMAFASVVLEEENWFDEYKEFNKIVVPDLASPVMKTWLSIEYLEG